MFPHSTEHEATCCQCRCWCWRCRCCCDCRCCGPRCCCCILSATLLSQRVLLSSQRLLPLPLSGSSSYVPFPWFPSLTNPTRPAAAFVIACSSFRLCYVCGDPCNPNPVSTSEPSDHSDRVPLTVPTDPLTEEGDHADHAAVSRSEIRSLEQRSTDDFSINSTITLICCPMTEILITNFPPNRIYL